MPSAAMVGSLCVGHGDFPARETVEGEPKFLIYGVPIHCTGHAWLPHTNSVGVTHGGSGIGSSKFMVFGKPACMVGDSVDCGSPIATGEDRFQIS
ncbi:PAAR domain-containing protein (plasmid) [Moritella sp. 24]|uniref:PAAR domain-containing protein n=1 Tax=Moritella sp. 24 TaxID=2746230 RepID=UPI001BA58544|nr:PAAR domain-containing protein [Moritella sp. 24]QUM78784.1 PAAR domain-containing protein [Moritella sp. 24]